MSTVMSQTNFSGELYASGLSSSAGVDLIQSDRSPVVADVRIVTSGGSSIRAHSSVLASASTVFNKILDQQKRSNSKKRIPILGVSSEAVAAFVEFLYSSRCSEVDMEKYGVHLLTLSHVYLIPQLKQRCTRSIAARLTAENVIDILQLARLCDAPELYVKCMKLVSNDFKSVEKTEGWKFLQEHDPWLELDILEFIYADEERRKETRKKKTEQSLYLQLSEAMECLEHICTDGCTSVGPYDKEPSKNKKPCSQFSTCQGLQLLIHHFATCTKRVNGGCSRCMRMWQLLKLHSSTCDQVDQCRVPLCRQFKMRMENVKKGHNNERWKLLVKKVVSARKILSLSSAKTMRISRNKTGFDSPLKSEGESSEMSARKIRSCFLKTRSYFLTGFCFLKTGACFSDEACF